MNSEKVLELRGVSKSFQDTPAVDTISFSVTPGEVFTLLGPSGCGKSTTLRLLAGLEHPDAGQILLRGRLIASGETRFSLPPERRHIGMVFQSYAIWPHMTVFENVAFPLRLRHVSRAEARTRVRDVLAIVGLGGLEDRPATKLSGGQQQRVALARAIVYSPDLLLLDEPLSNLDAHLREQMRTELKRIQTQLGVAVVFVTHDQAEAMMLSDRVGVMRDGKIEQIDTPATVYEQPSTTFVRDFLGRVLLLDGVIERDASGAHLSLPMEGTHLSMSTERLNGFQQHASVQVACRLEDVRIDGRVTGQPNSVGAVVDQVSYLGDRLEYVVRTRGGRYLSVFGSRREQLDVGARVEIVLNTEDLTLWKV